jgi:hypothetical protein
MTPSVLDFMRRNNSPGDYPSPRKAQGFAEGEALLDLVELLADLLGTQWRTRER